MNVELYTPRQRETAEARFGPAEREALGGELWDWRFEKSPFATEGTPCFGLLERSGLPHLWVSAVRTEVIASGGTVPAAQVIGGDLSRLSGDEEVDDRLLSPFLDRLREGGVKLVFGAVDPKDRAHAEALGFFALTESAVRSLYLGLGLSRRMGRERSFSPLRRIAQEAARIRTKLVEASLDDETAKRFAQSHAIRQREHSFGVHKTDAYLRWRYLEDPRHIYRFFTHRRRAGLGLDGFVVLRREENQRGRVETHVVDHWSREGGRRAHAVFLGEVVLWAMTEEAEVMRAFATQGTNVEQALVGMGGVRKKTERILVLKRLADDVPAPESLDPKKIDLRAGDIELYPSLSPARSD